MKKEWKSEKKCGKKLTKKMHKNMSKIFYTFQSCILVYKLYNGD